MSKERQCIICRVCWKKVENKAKEFEDKFEDKTAELDLKETHFNSLIKELKQQLNELGMTDE